MNYYPPANKDFRLPEGEKPALLVKIHGGARQRGAGGWLQEGQGAEAGR
jgi:hypothetical protein